MSARTGFARVPKMWYAEGMDIEKTLRRAARDWTNRNSINRLAEASGIGSSCQRFISGGKNSKGKHVKGGLTLESAGRIATAIGMELVLIERSTTKRKR